MLFQFFCRALNSEENESGGVSGVISFASLAETAVKGCPNKQAWFSCQFTMASNEILRVGINPLLFGVLGILLPECDGSLVQHEIHDLGI